MSTVKVLLLATLGLFPSALAQQARNAPETLPVLVNVVDLHGNVVRDLTKSDFRVRINGNPALISDAQYNVAPRRIVVVLDMSGSMAGETDNGKWQVAREVVDEFVTQMPSDGRIAMVTFSDQVHQIFDFSQGRTAVVQWLKQGPSGRANIKHQSPTPLFDAILAALKLLEPFQLGDVVYAITDGEENHSHSTKASTEATLLKSGVRLFASLFDEPMPSQAEEAKESFLEMVADSGGTVSESVSLLNSTLREAQALYRTVKQSGQKLLDFATSSALPKQEEQSEARNRGPKGESQKRSGF